MSVGLFEPGVAESQSRFSEGIVQLCPGIRSLAGENQSPTPTPGLGCLVRQVVNISLGILVAWLSVPVVINLLSSRQVMNTSFNPLRIVNTYGAFGRYGPGMLAGRWALPFCPSRRTLGKHELKAAPSTWGKVDTVDSLAAFIFPSITKERTEVILQGTASPNASAPDAVWEDYEFKCKPGDPWRRPCLISPYHYRLDWLMWFSAFQVLAIDEP